MFTFILFPRYAEPKHFNGIEFVDPGWPGAPDLSHVNNTSASTNLNIINHIVSLLGITLCVKTKS